MLSLLSPFGLLAQPSIDRQALVLRHTVHIDKPDPLSALSVGNGRFAFTVDITGLQTFPEFYDHGIPLGTESEWGWHSFADTSGYRREEASKAYHIHGRDIPYIVQWSHPERNKDAADWYRQNPHRLQLGSIGLELIKQNGQTATIRDITNIHQELDMWTGEIRSNFIFEGVPVLVSTLVHPEMDMVAVHIRSSLIGRDRIKIRLRFPYPTGTWADAGDDWQNPDLHRSLLVNKELTHALIAHILDSTRYVADWTWSGPGTLKQGQSHEFLLTPAQTRDSNFSFTCLFSPEEPRQPSPSWFLTRRASAEAWRTYWTSGAAVDLSGSTDPRAPELERRIVLSQYLTRIQSCGDYPPQETGLTYNSWFGRPHLEMHWWHEAHFALWGRPDLLEHSLAWYARVAPKARRIAERQGYKGVRWQKMTDTAGEEAPSSVGAFLIWQQPHFIYLAELCYRHNNDPAILQKYKDLVFATADFMASYAWKDEGGRYILGKGLIPAQEKFKAMDTYNPIFELAYWRWALGIAQQWRKRLGLQTDTAWQEVLDHLSALPRNDEYYLPAESAADAYTNPEYRTDHPVVLAADGFLPPTEGLDTALMHRTFDWVWKNWSWAATWGWDYPLTAMTATRLGLPDRAIDALLMPVQKNRYLLNGHNYQDDRLRLYLPGNGGLLAAIALMCAGYDGCDSENPGFPKNGKWKVRWEGLHCMP
ncbi:MAG: hypothetical protein Q8932_11960 [Bacteroidota bacterium]|nr:hypothetical protein [Bacteroidota bacterium]MDP4246551.1 hypothetical protein [Bacteroidota bacterium]MDP4254580.1 hypothetical protein [Bacteroidota bacterium]MDP4257904.1 hypothetical protein [Bacteroidota bacterium]